MWNLSHTQQDGLSNMHSTWVRRIMLEQLAIALQQSSCLQYLIATWAISLGVWVNNTDVLDSMIEHVGICEVNMRASLDAVNCLQCRLNLAEVKLHTSWVLWRIWSGTCFCRGWAHTGAMGSRGQNLSKHVLRKCQACKINQSKGLLLGSRRRLLCQRWSFS